MHGRTVDPETEITVCCGATEAMMPHCWRGDPGDEVIIFEPFYENYGADAILPSHAALRFTASPEAPDGE